MGPLPDRIEAANELASLARDNDRNKMIIVEEGGLPPLLKLLKESSAPDARNAAMTALRYLANDQGRVQAIVNELGVETILQILPSLSGARTTIEDWQSQPPPDQIIKANDDLSKRTRNLPDGGVLEVSHRVYDSCSAQALSFHRRMSSHFISLQLQVHFLSQLKGNACSNPHLNATIGTTHSPASTWEHLYAHVNQLPATV
ncbi:hypothetical protein EUGRSUZ_C01913 [Eucalyptus grandis]|uniref:Uncharacterized protein n=2 Tax=Eucalyptus grandis TaxID=71139 RepID=A0ACC3LE43_EUCGR|nr:hypothetical protein EUGRSUZ_C01913 [Eucalyptus grandis]